MENCRIRETQMQFSKLNKNTHNNSYTTLFEKKMWKVRLKIKTFYTCILKCIINAVSKF